MTIKITIVTAVYNNKNFIREALNSLAKQDYPHVEHLIIDGSSKDGTLDKIRKINGVFFDWKDNQKTYSGRDVGLIAQEVEEILPEVVSSRESGGKAIRYEKIVPLLVECIKDLSSQIQDLKSTINKLEK